MYGPGRYEPDPTEGITNVKDLPAPQLVAYHRDHKQTACPRCSQLASRHKSGQRLLHDLGDLCTGHPVDLLVTYSSHYCDRCKKHFNIDRSDVAPPVGTSGATTGYLFLLQPYRIGWRRGEKKAQEHMGGAFLEWALEAFSGYAAVDELYEGPYCVLSAVDNRHYKRVLYELLDHDATHSDIEAFLGRLKTALDERGLTLKGITTDGSALYPEPIRIVFGDVPHQLCTFHIIKDLTQGVLKAVATERERLAQSKPRVKRGRPSSKDKAARRTTRKSKAIQQKISDLFQNRFLFVKRRLTPSERQRLMRITRGLPHLRKLREIMELKSGHFFISDE